IFIILFLLLPIFFAAVTYLASFTVFSGTTIISAGQGNSRAKNFPGFWCVHSGPEAGFQRVVSPVFIMMYVTFINDRDETMFVDGFSIETKTPKGNWERMPIINVNPDDPSTVDFYFAPVSRATIQDSNRVVLVV